MSLLTKDGRISVKPFARVPALGDLPAILPAHSVSNVSSHRGVEEGVDLTEGCLVTKSVKYTHQLAHMVNAVRRGDPTEVEDTVQNLGIIPYSDFTLDDSCNLVFLEPFVHASLDLYAFVAVTPSASTLHGLITMVSSDNQRQQEEMDARGFTQRKLDFSTTHWTNPEYELVAIYPEHFLPVGSILPVYDSVTQSHKTYVPAQDRYLRESFESTSPRLPAFHHTSESRYELEHLNVFLVALNAELKFRRYLEKIRLDPPATPLPDDVLSLMHRTHELIELIYWVAKPTPGSVGAAVVAKAIAQRRQNKGIAARPDPLKAIESSFEEIGTEDVQSIYDPRGMRKTKRVPPWPQDADLETRMAYGRELMGGYDPLPFDDRLTGLYQETHLYSDKAAVEAWNNNITS